MKEKHTTNEKLRKSKIQYSRCIRWSGEPETAGCCLARSGVINRDTSLNQSSPANIQTCNAWVICICRHFVSDNAGIPRLGGGSAWSLGGGSRPEAGLSGGQGGRLLRASVCALMTNSGYNSFSGQNSPVAENHVGQSIPRTKSR